MSSIAERLSQVRENIASAQIRSGVKKDVTIVAVTKTHAPQTIIDIYNAGNTVIGENRVQEAADKFPRLPHLPGLVKRMVGHLQSNKVNRALEIFDTIDAVDSVKLANRIARRSQAEGIEIPVLLEINTTDEPSKFGFSPDKVDEMLGCCEIAGLAVQGLMTIGPLTGGEKAVRAAFTKVRTIKEELSCQLGEKTENLSVLSMGMSGDYQIAVEEGSTMVRLGTILFGPRKEYP